MTRSNNNRTKRIWLSVLILLVCVAATTVAFKSRLDSYLFDDEGAIPLIPEDISGTGDNTDKKEDMQDTGSNAAQTTTGQVSADNGDTTGTSSEPSTSATLPQAAQPSENPGFEASDDKTVWSTHTQLEIFHVSYVNGEQVITVNSDNGEKVIAPGTENSYTFKLKNTGNSAMDYTVEADAYFTPADMELPIRGRLSRYDGTWIVGGKEEYVEVSVLDTAEDHATLGAGKYTYYTLDWLWPFESGNDGLDTMFGNLAVDQELTFTIAIKTIATESTDPNDDSGITPPKTGDNMNVALWTVLAVGSFAMMIFFLFCQKRKKRNSDAEEEEN